jgi:hypothetical protein
VAKRLKIRRRFAKISAYYRHHAEADEAVFQRYAAQADGHTGRN